MKLLIIQEIDGIDVIAKIDNANGMVDPEMSKAAAKKLLNKTATAIEIDRIKSQMAVYAKQMIQARRNAKMAKSDAERQAFIDEYNTREVQFKELQEDLNPLAVTLKSEFQDLIRSNAVYFIPPPGNKLIEDANAESIQTKLTAAINSDLLLNRDLKSLCDHRGKRYFKKNSGKWQMQEITKIGVEPANGSILEADLTDDNKIEISEQAETDRIAALKPADRLAEKDRIIEGLAGEGNAMRGRLEIQGDKDALKKSQDWYNAELAKVEEKYK